MYTKDDIINDGGQLGGDAILTNMQNGIAAAHAPVQLETGFTDNTGGVGVALLTFTDTDGNALTAPFSGTMYFSEVATGLSAATVDTGIVAAKGVVTPLVTTSHYHFITNATGELDLTITSLADSYWLVFTNPDGTLLISDEMAIT